MSTSQPGRQNARCTWWHTVCRVPCGHTNVMWLVAWAAPGHLEVRKLGSKFPGQAAVGGAAGSFAAATAGRGALSGKQGTVVGCSQASGLSEKPSGRVLLPRKACHIRTGLTSFTSSRSSPSRSSRISFLAVPCKDVRSDMLLFRPRPVWRSVQHVLRSAAALLVSGLADTRVWL
jgi:hypothetical protein